MCDVRPKDQAEYKRLLDDIAEDYCPAGKYCILKIFLLAAHPSRRLLVQLRACDKFKYERSEINGSDIGWQRAMELWVSEGYAERFAEAYADDKPFKEVYKQTMRSK